MDKEASSSSKTIVLMKSFTGLVLYLKMLQKKQRHLN